MKYTCNSWSRCLSFQEPPVGGYSRPQEALQGVKERPGRPTGQEIPTQQNEDDDDDEGDDQSDSSEEDDDEEDAHGTALEGYDNKFDKNQDDEFY